MNSIPPQVARDEGRLGGLAMKVRGTRREADRRDIESHAGLADPACRRRVRQGPLGGGLPSAKVTLYGSGWMVMEPFLVRSSTDAPGSLPTDV
jgi:hypothetical protein